MEIIVGLVAAVFIALQTVNYIPKLSVSAEIKHHEVVDAPKYSTDRTQRTFEIKESTD